MSPPSEVQGADGRREGPLRSSTLSLLGQTVVLSGVSSRVGLATAQRAKAEGARLIIIDLQVGRLEELADEIGVEATASFDAQDPEQLGAFLTGLPMPIDHLLLISDSPCSVPLSQDLDQARNVLDRLLVPLRVARFAGHQMPAGGSLVFLHGFDPPQPGLGRAFPLAPLTALPGLIANLALAIAPVRVNLILYGRSAVRPEGVAALAVHLAANPELTGGIHQLGGAGLCAWHGCLGPLD